MNKIKKRFCIELSKFLKLNNCSDILRTYKKYNIHFLSNEEKLIILFNQKKYTVSIIIENDVYYWYLVPYNNSYFITKSKLVGNLDMILLAIKEDFEMYNK